MSVAAQFAELLYRHGSPYFKLPDALVAALAGHYELLTNWNKRINLTSVRTLEDAVVRHYCESLFLGARLSVNTTNIVDIGSGAGFPGLPIAVFRPDAEVTLVESHQRKAVFLREAARGLSNVRVLASRAQAVTEKFDVGVSRAVQPMEVVGLLPRLANRVALLVGEADAATLRGYRLVNWEDPVKIPWGDRRVILSGECFTWNSPT